MVEAGSAEELELSLIKPAHGGHCVARHEGMVILVRHGIPGERVIARVTERRRRLWFAEVIRVLSPSPDRVEHLWPQAAQEGIGGVELGHVSLERQLDWKQSVLAEALAHHARYEQPVSVHALSASDQANYRTRLRLHRAGCDAWGVKAHRSHSVVPISTHPLAVPQINALDWNQWQIEDPHQDTLIAVAPSAGSALLVNPNDRSSVSEKVRVTGHQFHYEVAASGFWQNHRLAPGILANQVITLAQPAPGEIVWDLFSGAGLFTLPLAHHVGRNGSVQALEGDRRATALARRNLQEYPWARARAGDVSRGLRALADPDVIVADPPRTGLGRELITTLSQTSAERFVYVACDPIALARDAGYARDAGWQIVEVHMHDLFPHTHHVESIALMTRIAA